MVGWVSSRIGAGETAAPGGIFDRIGNFVVRRPLVVIAAWILLAGVLALVFPPLPAQTAKYAMKPFPDDAPTKITADDMTKAFGNTGTGGALALIILTDEKGISPADEDVYRKLVDKLHEDTQDKLGVQDFITTPPMREVLASKDGKAFNLPVTIPGEPAAPATLATFKRITAITKQVTAGTTLTSYLSGPVATVSDLTDVGFEDMDTITIGTIFAVLLILFVIYRNVVTMLVPLLLIGACIGTSQGVVSALAEIGLAVNMQTIVLMSAVMIGAGTDYAVFLISRYHDFVKHGENSDVAVKNALMAIGKVIAASAATVAITFLAMVFTKLQVFSEVGPAISVSVIVSFLAAITLLPAILVLTGRRGWIKPRRDLTTTFWRRTGTRIVRRPRIHLVASLIVLVAMAACSSMVRFNYDDLKSLPEDVDSSKGYDAMDRHFPKNSMTPLVLLIQSSHDLRTPNALADLEQIAGRVSQLPDITMVRGLTRPNGEPLEQTKVSFQAGEVGSKLDEASDQIQNHGGDLDKLVNGADQLADALAQIRTQVTGAVSSLSGVVSALTTMEQLMGGDALIGTLQQAGELTGRMKSLGDNLNASTVDAQNIAGWASPMVRALNASPDCNADPGCVSSRAGLASLVTADNDGTLNSIKGLARNMQATGGAQTVGQTLNKMQQSLNQAVTVLKTIKGLQSDMNALEQGSGALADGSKALAGGVRLLVDQTKKIGAGLGEASSFLLGMKHDANAPAMAGFNIPPQIMTKDEFKKGAQIFISPDGHAARYLVQSAIDPFSVAAMDQVTSIVNAARSALPNTELSDAKIALAGIPSGLKDTRDYYNNDINFIIFATIIIVFLILVVLLRALIAPIYLIASVLLSYMSALGVGVLVFQGILGKDLHWSLPGLSFILLVAVGADYNMLLISRIRDESPHGVRVGVIRTVGSTGGVITSAGLIFAASMFGLMTASIYTMAEAGFIIGAGILIDTFVVRTITVPALASMIGQKNWWPSQLGKSTSEVTAAHAAKQRQRMRLSGELTRLKIMPSRKTRTASSALPATGVAAGKGGHTATTSREASVEYVTSHSLPLFDLSGVAHRLTDDIRKSRSVAPSTTNGNGVTNGHTNGTGKKPADHYLGHSLPLFGSDVLSYRLAKMPTSVSTGRSNGGDHPNGDDGGGIGDEQSIDHYEHALPVFGRTGLSHEPTNGNGKTTDSVTDPTEGQLENDPDFGQSLPLFRP
jgi:RND superfamily putative drug exporter